MVSKYFFFSPFDFDAMENYLEHMAQKGYEVKRIEGSKASFTRVEPYKALYRVEHCSEHDSTGLLSSYQENGWGFVTKYSDSCYIFGADCAQKLLRFGNIETEPVKKAKAHEQDIYVYTSMILFICTIGFIWFFYKKIYSVPMLLCYEIAIFFAWLMQRMRYRSLLKSLKSYSIFQKSSKSGMHFRRWYFFILGAIVFLGILALALRLL